VEGSRETARLTAELFRTVISQQRVTSAALVEVVRDVGQQLIAANPVGMCVFPLVN
jgi:translation initiation factor eIF-2B subunit beta